MSYATLEVRRAGPVGWLVFDRPEVANAIDATMFDELEAAWAELDGDDAVRAIVNTGNGTAFQTGLDVRQLARDPAALKRSARQTRDAELRLTAWHCGVDTPVIAAVNGVCAGGGLHFVADADLVVASSTASFLDPHVSVGQVSAYETIGLVTQAPAEAVMRMALVGNGERMSAERAHQLGIVSEVVHPPEALVDRAQALGEQIAAQPPELVRALKRAVWQALDRPGRLSQPGRPSPQRRPAAPGT